MSSHMTNGSQLYSLQTFTPEVWMAAISSEHIPISRVTLGRLPTPIHPLRFLNATSSNVEMYVKRDDLTSFDLSGNKVRKLEFLLADALLQGYDGVVTIGGLQSNHCRATAVAARQLGLDPYLILRTDKQPEEIDLEGNLLLSRMVGTKIYTVAPKDYYAKGGDFFVHQVAERLRTEQGRKIYEIPCGGSNLKGSFGYIDAVTELMRDCGIEKVSLDSSEKVKFPYDHIVFGCGSGGTAAGLAIGVHLAQLDVQVHAVAVCDTPDEFYDSVQLIAERLGLACSAEEVRRWLRVHQGRGLGYSVSSEEELQFLYEFSSQTGLTLDPVYSGKAMYTLCTQLLVAMPDVFQPGQKILFIHTGGTMGAYSKAEQLLHVMGKDHAMTIESL